MRIRTQITLTAVVILGTLALMTATAVYQQRGRTELARAQTELDRLLRGAQELGSLSGELVIYPSERVREQWRARDASFATLLDSPLCCRDTAGKTLLESVREARGRLAEIFDRILALGPAAEDSAPAAEFRARLASQLLATHRDVSGLLRDLNGRERDSALAELHRAGRLVVLVNVSAFALTALLLWLLWRNLSRPLAQLGLGFERVGGGDMEHRVDNGRRDEFGELARGFDRMTEQVGGQRRRLRASEGKLAAANRRLERKVAERTAELDQANADLEKAVRQLYDAGTELAYNERLVTLGKLVASVSHELNNPLMGALNYVQYVEAKLSDISASDSLPDAQCASLTEWLGKAERDILRASRVTESLLDFGRKRDEHRDAVCPRELVAGTLELAAPVLHRGGVAAENLVPPNLRDVFGQQDLLRQVLLNLILNAVDALQGVQDRRIVIGGQAAKHRIELFVQDSGPGVPEAIRERIFDPFFTTKPKGEGSGLGLSIARRLVEGGGGSLRYQPGDPGGRFVLRLPPVNDDRDNGDSLLLEESVSINLSSEPEQLERG